jgi:hypothetical protein
MGVLQRVKQDYSMVLLDILLVESPFHRTF